MDIEFPDPKSFYSDGLIAVGGDITVPYLIAAYRKGIFPWYEEDTEPQWWSPDPRCVLFPSKIKIHASMRQVLHQKNLHVTWNTCFEEVIQQCRRIRLDQDGTWLSPALIDSYTELHHAGLAHSVEVWQNKQLVGGLYGVLTGHVFSGESMFHLIPNTSKVALIHLCKRCVDRGLALIDCQQVTPHLIHMGADIITRAKFLKILKEGLDTSIDLNDPKS